MLKINKLKSLSPIDYAAEELKKYLRMMMPEGGDIEIAYDPAAKEGFRLGLMADLGLDVSDAEELELDDIIYINCDASGGIIAGSNPRSVLLSVYEYLRQNGCRWLMPGVDGEYIPMKDIEPVKYRHKASMRYRGWCNEGAEFQQSMLEAIDFLPKVGMNVFMLEFRIPMYYYNNYYNHDKNAENRPVESVSEKQVLQWKRQCEAEIAKRGLQFHDIGHGFTCDPFGIDSSKIGALVDDSDVIPDEARKYLALLGGKRSLYRHSPLCTNFCMSSAEARSIMASYVADYAESHSNVDYLHIWLADYINNHCECDECSKKSVSDWYVILLNEIDEVLLSRGLHTRIVFIVYLDTFWAPIAETIRNHKRFSLLFAPISRTYTMTLPKTPSKITLTPFVRNKLVSPSTLEASFAYLAEWKRAYKGAKMSYEYHFWRHIFSDVSGIVISKRINEDVKAYEANGVSGIIEDGSQRCFFPNGYAFYTYARSLFDTSLTTEDIAGEFFPAAYGEDYREFYSYLEKLGELIDFGYFYGADSENPKVSRFYSRKKAEDFAKAKQLVGTVGRDLIAAHYNSDVRLRTVSVRLLEHHADFVTMLADVLIAKALAKDEEASRLAESFRIEFGKREAEIELWYDHSLAFKQYAYMLSVKSNTDEVVINFE